MVFRIPRGASILLLLPLSAAPAAAQGRTWALTNARIETVANGVIPRGTVVIQDGLIAAVGRDVALPPEAWIVDLAGRTVSPGLIDLTSTVGLPALGAGGTAARGGGGPGGGGGGLDPRTADRRVAEELSGAASDLRSARDAGITGLLIAPNRGLFRGLSALVVAGDSLDARAVITSPVGEHVGYQGAGFGTYPGSLMGVIAFQRQTLYDAARYGMLRDRWQADPRGIERPPHDPALEALVPVVRGELPVFVSARNENEIRRASRLGREHRLRMVIVGAVDGWRAVDALRGHGVVVEVNFPRPNEVVGWKYRTGLPRAPGDSTALQEQARRVIERNPAALHQAGIRFALASGGTRAADFVANLRKAVAAGLPAEVALAGATIRAAELAGTGNALGTIEPGKIANLVVTNGPLLADTARVFMTFVDGRRYDGPPPPRADAAGGRAAGGRAGAGGGGGAGAAVTPVAGTWVITTQSPQGANEGTLTITQDGGRLSGSMASPLGTSTISDGRVQGRRMSWTITISIGGNNLTLAYDGLVDGDRITGTVTAGELGSFPFSGERQP